MFEYLPSTKVQKAFAFQFVLVPTQFDWTLRMGYIIKQITYDVRGFVM